MYLKDLIFKKGKVLRSYSTVLNYLLWDKFILHVTNMEKIKCEVLK